MDIGNVTNKSKSKEKYFGTDGFRGEANVTLTPIQAYKIGRFLGWNYSNKKSKENRARIVLGKDTRQSGYMLEYAISAGLVASGADVYLMHVTTTPSISYICKEYNFDCGVMITASHNPFYDNGIKVINKYGEKLEEDTTDLIEDYIDGTDNAPLATRREIGRIFDYSDGREKYIEHLISLFPNSLRNLRIGIDCANGSSSMIAERVFSELGAEAVLINNKPSGTNINEDCGSTHLDSIQEIVLKEKLDVGFAFDGDADRCIAVDSNGNIIDGDKLIYIIAKRFKRLGILNKNTVAVTVMSNFGFVNALKNEGIDTLITPVGDKYVYQALKDYEFQLGGEQSGHIIMTPFSITGDGLLTALVIANEMVESKAHLSDLCKGVVLYPQMTANLKVKNKIASVNDDVIIKKISELNDFLANKGRILLRASGTEDVLRLTVEAPDMKTCGQYIELLSQTIKEREDLI